MWNLVVIFVGVLFAIIAINSEKMYFNAITIMNFLWATISLLSSKLLFKLLPANNEVYFHIFIGLIFFNIGYYARKILGRRIIISQKESNDEINYSLLYFLGIITIIVLLKSCIESLLLLFNGNTFGAIRIMTASGYVNNSSEIENVIKNFITGPCTYAILTIFSVDFWLGKKDKKLRCITILLVILNIIIAGGRIVVFYLGVPFLVSYMFSRRFYEGRSNRNNQMKKKGRKQLIFWGIMALFLLLIISVMRSKTDNIITTLYYYFSIEPIMLQSWEKSVPEKLYGLGVGSLNGYFFSALYLIKNFFNLDYPDFFIEIFNLINETDQIWRPITTSGRIANAYVSLFWFFYLDGRLFGIILGDFIYGYVLANAYVNSKKYFSKRNVAIYSLLIYGVLFSFVRFQFASIYYALAFFYIKYVFFIKKKRFKMGKTYV